MNPRWTLVEGTPAHRRYQAVSWSLVVLGVVLVGFAFAETWDPVIFGDKYTVGLDSIGHAVSLMVAVLGLNFLIGFSGQVSLGHSFFIGVGAYMSGVLIELYSWPYLATLVVVIPACFLFGMVVGIPALRIKGLYLALVTLVLAVIFPTLVRLDSVDEYTNGSNGLVISGDFVPPRWLPLNGFAEFLQAIPVLGRFFGSDGLSERELERVWRYLILVAIAAVCVWLVVNMIKSRPGRAIIAIRDNETGAAVSGVNLPLYKTVTFGISAALAGVSGVMFTIAVGALAPDSFGINLAIFLIVGLVVGGVATHSGAVIGGLAIIFIPAWSSQWATQTDSFLGLDVSGDKPFGTLLLGVMLIVITFVMPGGVVSGLRKIKGRVVRVIPAPPVPTTLRAEPPGGGLTGGDPAEAEEVRPG